MEPNSPISESFIASVIVDIAIDKPLEYLIPFDQIHDALPGSRVEIPVRNKSRKGFILEVKEGFSNRKLASIYRVLNDTPRIPKELLELAVWISRFYCTSLRDVFRMFVPPEIRKGMKQKEQLYVMRARNREVLRERCKEIRIKKPSQASVLDAMLQVKKGILLTKLLEQTQASRSSVDALVKMGDLTVDTIQIDRSPLIGEEYILTKSKPLNIEQATCLEKILRSLSQNVFETHLVFGITGSGKTEVYMQAIEKALELGKGSILLVPEISLTGQAIERFRSRFQERIAILHHRLSEGERRDEWHHIQSGQAKIVIGARSAIFSPIVNLGLIIVDEEHEQSYKQNEVTPCYQARDVAVMRGKLCQASVILGSATPSLESFYNVKKGKYTLSTLSTRAGMGTLAEVQIVDMKKEYEKNKGFTSFSEALLSGIHHCLKNGEQIILFLNRRGYHTSLLCQGCGECLKCPHCEITYTFHLGDNHLACHLCGNYIQPPPKICPSCRKDAPLKFRGVGTEQIEKALYALFPESRILRMDADTTKHKGSHQQLLREFGTGKADILIGTQMIAKGLHFPEVTLVGVLNCDSGLQIPDFRASEITFQLITQVAGRAGRGVSLGKVILQTCIPENSTIQHAAKQDYQKFYEEEIKIRECFHYPPFSQMIKVVFVGKESELVFDCACAIREDLIKQLPKTYQLHPVVPCGHPKIKDEYRFQLLLRSSTLSQFYPIFEEVRAKKQIPSSIRLSVDVHPSSTFF